MDSSGRVPSIVFVDEEAPTGSTRCCLSVAQPINEWSTRLVGAYLGMVAPTAPPVAAALSFLCRKKLNLVFTLFYLLCYDSTSFIEPFKVIQL